MRQRQALTGEGWIVLERQFDGPIVREVHGRPVVVVERQGADWTEISVVGRFEMAETKILCRVGGMTEVESPAEIEQEAFA